MSLRSQTARLTNSQLFSNACAEELLYIVPIHTFALKNSGECVSAHYTRGAIYKLTIYVLTDNLMQQTGLNVRTKDALR